MARFLANGFELNDPAFEAETTGTAYFRHIYYSNGFAISKRFLPKGTKEDYRPTSRHACLDNGYFCIKQIKEEPSKLLIYIVVKIYNSLRKIKSLAQKLYDQITRSN